MTPGSRIYVAGASAEAEIIAGHMTRLRAAGQHVSYDWTVEVIRRHDKGLGDPDMSSDERLVAASLDAEALRHSNAVWLLVPSGRTGSVGAWVELGMGLACRHPVIVSGDWRRSIFTSLALRRFDTHEEAFGWLAP